MKIAIYYPWVYLTSGVERVILEICKRSKHDYTIFTNHFDKKNTYPGFRRFKVVELKRIPLERNLFSVTKAAITIASQKINLLGYDLLFVHSDGLGDLILSRNRQVPTVCFCHTPLRPVFDKHYRKRAIVSRDGLRRLMFFVFSFFFKVLDGQIWRTYDYVFFNSNETLSRAKAGGLIKSLKGRHEVLHPGVDTKVYKPTRRYKPYFLSAGRIMWTKNIQLGIKAFIKFKNENPKSSNFKLVIAGQVDKKSEPYIKELQAISKNREDIKYVISPTDRKLRDLYSDCWTVLQTSFNEDWGLTLLEGNACGKPVIAVKKGGPMESQVDGVTGYLVNPKVNDFAKRMALLAGNKKLILKLGRGAYKNSKKYGWTYFINRIDKVFEEIRCK